MPRINWKKRAMAAEYELAGLKAEAAIIVKTRVNDGLQKMAADLWELQVKLNGRTKLAHIMEKFIEKRHGKEMLRKVLQQVAEPRKPRRTRK